MNGAKVNIPPLHLKSRCKMHLKWRPGTDEVNIHHGIQPHSPIRIYTRVQTHLSLSCSDSFCQANTSLHSQTKWGNRSKLFAYKLMKHCKVKLSWMLITKVMHNLLINVSLHFFGRDGGIGEQHCGCTLNRGRCLRSSQHVLLDYEKSVISLSVCMYRNY